MITIENKLKIIKKIRNYNFKVLRKKQIETDEKFKINELVKRINYLIMNWDEHKDYLNRISDKNFNLFLNNKIKYEKNKKTNFKSFFNKAIVNEVIQK